MTADGDAGHDDVLLCLLMRCGRVGWFWAVADAEVGV